MLFGEGKLECGSAQLHLFLCIVHPSKYEIVLSIRVESSGGAFFSLTSTSEDHPLLCFIVGSLLGRMKGFIINKGRLQTKKKMDEARPVTPTP